MRFWLFFVKIIIKCSLFCLVFFKFFLIFLYLFALICALWNFFLWFVKVFCWVLIIFRFIFKLLLKIFIFFVVISYNWVRTLYLSRNFIRASYIFWERSITLTRNSITFFTIKFIEKLIQLFFKYIYIFF